MLINVLFGGSLDECSVSYLLSRDQWLGTSAVGNSKVLYLVATILRNGYRCLLRHLSRNGPHKPPKGAFYGLWNLFLSLENNHHLLQFNGEKLATGKSLDKGTEMK